MISDNERRDVARRLREWTWKSAPPECLLNQLVFGDDCPGTDDDPDTIDCHQCEVIAAKRLADLIEPPARCPHYHSGRHYCSVHEDMALIDRDALLALTDDVAYSAAVAAVVDSSTSAKLLADMLLDIVSRIREACGEVVE